MKRLVAHLRVFFDKRSPGRLKRLNRLITAPHSLTQRDESLYI